MATHTYNFKTLLDRQEVLTNNCYCVCDQPSIAADIAKDLGLRLSTRALDAEIVLIADNDIPSTHLYINFKIIVFVHSSEAIKKARIPEFENHQFRIFNEIERVIFFSGRII